MKGGGIEKPSSGVTELGCGNLSNIRLRILLHYFKFFVIRFRSSSIMLIASSISF